MPPVQNIEDAISDALQGRGQNIPAAPKEAAPGAGTRQQDPARGVAQHVVSECDSLALAIQETGRTVVNIATTISAETEALAELLRKHGEAMGVRIEEFMTMSDRVRDKMRAVHGDVAGVSGEERSPAPQHRDSDETEM
jgi:hypothetical protein